MPDSAGPHPVRNGRCYGRSGARGVSPGSREAAVRHQVCRTAGDVMKAEDLRAKSIDELNEELVALRREQFNLRMQHATGELTQNHEHGRVKRDIARVKTVLVELSRAAGENK